MLNFISIIKSQHGLNEYLDSTQLQMLAKRKGPTGPGDTFTDRWTGVDHRIKMRKIPSMASDSTSLGDSMDADGNKGLRRKLLRGANIEVILYKNLVFIYKCK